MFSDLLNMVAIFLGVIAGLSVFAIFIGFCFFEEGDWEMGRMFVCISTATFIISTLLLAYGQHQWWTF